MGKYKKSNTEPQFHPELETLKVDRNETPSEPETDLRCQDFDDVLEIIGPQGRDYERPPGNDGLMRYSQCSMYSSSSNRTIIPCTMGWEYDKSEYESTMSSAFNWVCDQKQVPTNTFTAQALGNALGTMIFGHMADKIGRKPIVFLTLFINIAFRFASFFVGEMIEVYIIIQFLIGTAFPLMFIAPSMIVAEICDKDYRGWVYAFTWMIWVVGMAALPLVVWACQQWFIIGIATTAPGLVLFAYWFHLPESPRWLFSVGKLEQSSKILFDIAKCNGRGDKVTKSQLYKTLKRLQCLQVKSDGPIGVWTLFRRARLATNTILLTVCWSINIVVYYGMTLNTTHMSGNQFVNFFLLSIIELPSSFMGAYLVDRVGRRWTQVVFFFGCGFTCAFAGVVVQYMKMPVVEILTVVVAKFAITLTFLVVYLQGAEIFPTTLRSTGSGLASTVGAACGIVGPIMVAMGTYNVSYPYWIMGSLCFMGMICAAFLPETLNQSLPESIEDAEKFGKGVKFWSLYPKPVSEDICGSPANASTETTSNHVIKTDIT